MANKCIITAAFAIGILSQLFFPAHFSVYAPSASFANQQVEAGRVPTQDCIVIRPLNQTNIPKSLANDIVGVTYSSDGQNLVLTLWLKETIMHTKNQSLQGRPLSSYLPPESVQGSGNYQDLKKALEEIAALYNETLPEAGDQLHLFKNGDRAAFRIQNDSKNSSQVYAKFELSNLNYSSLYTAVDILDELGVRYTWEALGNDTIKSFYQDYRMFVDIKSVYDTGWDYVAKFSWNDIENKWSYTMGQYNPSTPWGEPGKEVSNDHPIIHNNFIDNAINLSALKYPSDLWIMFQMLNTVTTEYGKCEFYDRTDLVPIPPPRVYMNAEPDSLELVPGEKSRIQLIVNSSTDIGAEVHFAIANKSGIENSGIDIVRGPAPEKVLLPSRSLATSELEVRPNVKNESYTSVLRPFANVSFVTPLIVGSYGNETTSLVHIIVDSEIPVSVKAPKGPIEQMAEGLDNAKVFAEKVSGLLAAIAIIVGAGGIGGFVAWLRKIKRRKTQSESSKDEQLRSEHLF